jgi:hypothetical protein
MRDEGGKRANDINEGSSMTQTEADEELGRIVREVITKSVHDGYGSVKK